MRESALLAGLPRAPTTYSPFEHGEAAKRRREVVLRRMVEYGALKDADAKRLARSDLGLIPPERRRTTGQYFLEYVQQTLEAKYGADLVFKGGLNVYTTLNPTMQLAAEQALREGLKALEGRHAEGPARPRRASGRRGRHDRAATGYVRAMVGGYDFFRSEFNRAVQARRQPGSAFKPFIYIAALEAGLHRGHPRRGRAGVLRRSAPDGQAWKPENYDRKFRGQTTLQQALEESVNIVTVKVQEQVGLSRTIQVARRFGITSPLDVNLSLALGTSDLTLLEMTSAYGALANQGQWLPPTAIRYVTDAQGKLVEEHAAGAARGGVARRPPIVITHMLRGRGRARDRAGGEGPRPADRRQDRDDQRLLERVVHRLHAAAWPPAIWVGYDRPRSLGKDETGSRVAVPIWVNYMGKVLGDSPKEDFAMPERVVLVPVDLDPSNECVRVVPMAFVRGTEPAVGCGPRRQSVPGSDAPPGAAPPAASAWRPQSSVPAPVAPPVAELPPPSPPPPAAALPNDTLEVPSVSAPVTHGAPTPVRSAAAGAVRAQPSARGYAAATSRQAVSPSSFAKTPSSSAMGTRICSIESRSRIVTR